MASLSTLEAGDNLSDLVDRVATGKERIIITRAGKELVTLVPVEDLEHLEDLEDYYLALERSQNPGGEPVSLEDVIARLGLDDSV